MIFFLTNKFIESDQFKEDWRISQKKVFLIVLLENTPPLSFIFDLNQLYVFNNFGSFHALKLLTCLDWIAIDCALKKIRLF